MAAIPPKTTRASIWSEGSDSDDDEVIDKAVVDDGVTVTAIESSAVDNRHRSDVDGDDIERTDIDEEQPESSSRGSRAASSAARTTRRSTTRRQRTEARKVRRLIRHIDPWSVLKASLLFFLSLWFIFMIAAAIVWTVGRGSGTIDKVETFVQSNLGQPDFRFDGNFLFRQVGLIGLVMTLAWTLAATIASVVFNLISDIIGGVWVTVIEEESIRVRRD